MRLQLSLSMVFLSGPVESITLPEKSKVSLSSAVTEHKHRRVFLSRVFALLLCHESSQSTFPVALKECDYHWINSSSAPVGGRSNPPGGWEAHVLTAFRREMGLKSLEPAQDIWAAGADSSTAAAMARLLEIEPKLLVAYPNARLLARYLQGDLTGAPCATLPHHDNIS